MVKGPGFFSDIGKKTRDLLYKDQPNDTFSFITYPLPEIAITSAVTRCDIDFLANVAAKLKTNNITTRVKVDTNSNILTRITYAEPAFGVKTNLSFIIPDKKSGKFELQYQHKYIGIIAAIGLTSSPMGYLSGMVGNDVLSVGADCSYDFASGNLTKWNAGLNFTRSGFIGSLALHTKYNKCDSLNASYYYPLSPLTKSAVGVEFSHFFSKNENILTIGTERMLDPSVSMKARVDNCGIASVTVKQDWSKFYLTYSTEVNIVDVEKHFKLGVSIFVKP